jgi:coatomer subunit beta'
MTIDFKYLKYQTNLLLSHFVDPSHGPERRKPYQNTGGICDGLYYLHIVHLVLQPTNILLDYNMMPKIVDFDLSRSYHEKQNWLITSNLIGTM